MLFEDITAVLGKTVDITQISTCPAPHVREAWLLDGAQPHYDDDILYFVPDVQQLASGNLPRQFITVGVPDFALSGEFCAASVASDGLLKSFNLARKAVEASTGSGVYESLMDVARQSQSIDRVVNAAAAKLGNPIIFCDSEFRIISYSTTVPVIDPIWTDNIEKGYCPYEFVEGARSLESVRNAPMAADAIEVTCTESPYRKLTSRVLLGDAYIGFALMIASETPISLVHFDMLRNLSLVLTYAVQHFASYLLGGVGPYQQLIYKLLIGAPAESIAPQLALLSFPQTMTALCIRQTRYSGQQYLKESLSVRFCSLVPAAHIAIYEGAIAATIPVETGTEPAAELMDAIRAFAEEEHLFVGVSHSFNHIENFADHYRQALAAIELSKRLGSGDKVCLFRDYVFYDILASGANSLPVGSRCHPALQKLRLHDANTGSDLYNTLRCYVDAGGVVKETAQALFIHRNSLNYRLELITKIIGVDLGDPAIRHTLKLSFDMDRYSGMAD